MRIDEFARKDMGKREEPISEFIKELQDFLEGASYTLDRIEGEMAVLENRKSKEMIEIPYVELPTSVKEGDILASIYTNIDNPIFNLERIFEIS